ncbi:MAG TPA: DUF4031 domain-containing protein [Anaerolineae bacterium]|nr:DUF4031 domain-containing protein [Anaerolineae bacterium]
MSTGHDTPSPITFRGRETVHCHLVADTIEELHEAAAQIGLARNWYQPTSYPHYDVMSQRLVGKACRLVPEVGRRELLAMAKRCASAVD